MIFYCLWWVLSNFFAVLFHTASFWMLEFSRFFHDDLTEKILENFVTIYWKNLERFMLDFGLQRDYKIWNKTCFTNFCQIIRDKLLNSNISEGHSVFLTKEGWQTFSAWFCCNTFWLRSLARSAYNFLPSKTDFWKSKECTRICEY